MYLLWNAAFKIDGKVVAGFGAFAKHLSYFPHSDMVLSELSEDLVDHKWTKGTLQFSVGTPLSKSLLKKLIATRLRRLREP